MEKDRKFETGWKKAKNLKQDEKRPNIRNRMKKGRKFETGWKKIETENMKAKQALLWANWSN